MTQTPIVKLVDVTFQTANGTKLINSINLELYPGEIFAIVGPNGAGKTTLLQLISGLLQPTKGTIYHSSVSLKLLTPHERARKIAVINQTEQPNSRLTVREYISLGAIPHERSLSVIERNNHVEEAIQLLGLKDLSDKTIDLLSGGERQRAFIARAICQRPDVLLLDEPTNHLDPKSKGDVLSIISGLGITIIAVLHELALAVAFADKILILKDSEAVAFGPPEVTLKSEVVREVFGVDILRFKHPVEERDIVCLDIPLSKNNKYKGFV